MGNMMIMLMFNVNHVQVNVKHVVIKEMINVWPVIKGWIESWLKLVKMMLQGCVNVYRITLRIIIINV